MHWGFQGKSDQLKPAWKVTAILFPEENKKYIKCWKGMLEGIGGHSPPAGKELSSERTCLLVEGICSLWSSGSDPGAGEWDLPGQSVVNPEWAALEGESVLGTSEEACGNS